MASPKNDQEKRDFECVTCKLHFSSEEEYEEHNSTHIVSSSSGETNTSTTTGEDGQRSPAAENPPKVDSSIPDPETISNSAAKQSPRGRPHVCTTCDATFTRRDHLTRHRKNVHEEVSTPSQKAAYKTIKLECGSTVHRCPKCDFRSPARSEICDHMRSHAGKIPSYRCDECDMDFTRKDNLTRHNKVKHSPGGVVQEVDICCSVCGECFDSLKELSRHKTQVHEAEKRKHKCDKCGYAFLYRNHLVRHLQNVHNIVSEKKDDVCNTENDEVHVGSGESLSDIPLSDVIDIQPKGHSCDQCDFTCNDKGEFVEHMKSHEKSSLEGQNSSGLSYACLSCEFTTDEQTELDKHSKTHIQLLLHCNRCDFTCTDKGRLEDHIISHTNDRPWKCTSCGASFSRENQLERHTKTHKRDSAFVGPMRVRVPLIKPVVRSDLDILADMNCHKKSVRISLSRLHNCDKCEYCCISMRDLESHMRSHIEESDDNINKAMLDDLIKVEKLSEPPDSPMLNDLDRNCQGQTEQETLVPTLDQTDSTMQVKDNDPCHSAMDVSDLEKSSQGQTDQETLVPALDKTDDGTTQIKESDSDHCAMDVSDDVTKGLAGTSEAQADSSVSSAGLVQPVVEVASENTDGPVPPTDSSKSSTSVLQGSSKSSTSILKGSSKPSTSILKVSSKSLLLQGSSRSLLKTQSKSEQTVEDKGEQIINLGDLGIVVLETNKKEDDNLVELQSSSNTSKPQNLSLDAIKSETCSVDRPVTAQKKQRKQYQCATCGEAYINIRLFFRHLKETDHEPVQTVFKCECCDFVAMSKGGLSLHQKCHPSLLTCTVCQEVAASRPDLVKHMKEKHEVKEVKHEIGSSDPDNNEYRCTKCKFLAPSYSEMERHCKIHNCICPVCDEQFDNRRKLKFHMNTHPKDKKYICEICGAAFTVNNNLTVHLRIHKGTVEKKHKCPHCDYCSLRPADVQKHMRKHTRERPYQCAVCNKTFKQQSHLHAHLRLHTDIRPHKCTQCSAAFAHRYELNKHIKVHMGIKQYQCKECPYASYYSSALTKHMRTHTGERPFPCNVCMKAFKHRSVLLEHQKRHYGAKAFACSMCDFRSHRRRSVLRHQTFHFTKKKHPCTQCDMSFAFKTQLRRHTLQHTSGNRFMCRSCDFLCNDKTELNTHVKLQHRVTRTFKCALCARNFNRKYNLEKHMKQHFVKKKGSRVEGDTFISEEYYVVQPNGPDDPSSEYIIVKPKAGESLPGNNTVVLEAETSEADQIVETPTLVAEGEAAMVVQNTEEVVEDEYVMIVGGDENVNAPDGVYYLIETAEGEACIVEADNVDNSQSQNTTAVTQEVVTEEPVIITEETMIVSEDGMAEDQPQEIVVILDTPDGSMQIDEAANLAISSVTNHEEANIQTVIIQEEA